jgi:hypothetical protein
MKEQLKKITNERKERALDNVYDSINEALMNEKITMDEIICAINSRLEEYVEHGIRLIPSKGNKVKA